MIKAIVFDLDGTLLDTSLDIQKTINESLRTFALPEISLSETIEFIGNGARTLVVRALKGYDELVDSVYEDYVPRFAHCSNELTRLFVGEKEFLEFSKSIGIKLAIVTNKPQKATEHVYAQFLSSFSFDCVMGFTGEYPLKPDPQSTFAVMSKLSVSAGECLFVGDGETDIETAKNAGIRCISALWGYRTKSILKRAGAMEFAERFEDLRKFVIE